jgi:hypothetical protein
VELDEVRKCVKQNVDPTERYPSASIETAMHAVLAHRVVLHVHCVNTIAWAVRQDAPVQLEHVLHGMRWLWIPYVENGQTPVMAATFDKLVWSSRFEAKNRIVSAETGTTLAWPFAIAGAAEDAARCVLPEAVLVTVLPAKTGHRTRRGQGSHGLAASDSAAPSATPCRQPDHIRATYRGKQHYLSVNRGLEAFYPAANVQSFETPGTVRSWQSPCCERE